VEFEGGYVFRYILSEPSGSTDLVNTVGYPLRFRFRDLVSMKWGPLESNLTLLYSCSYRNITLQPKDVGSWTTLNARLAWRVALDEGRNGRAMTFSVSVENAFDRGAPFVNNALAVGWDPVNGNVFGRMIRLGVTVELPGSP
jgi:hypothetical protein